MSTTEAPQIHAAAPQLRSRSAVAIPRVPHDWVTVCFIAVLLLAPIWGFRYVPLVDYPNHLARSFVLAHLHDPGFQFQAFYRSDWRPYPYLAMDFLLVALQQIVTVATASRIFLSLCVVSAPLGCWYFLRKANRGSEALAIWSALLSYGTFFLLGSVNLQLSIGICLFWLGYWLSSLGSRHVIRYMVLAALAIVLYLTHLFGFCIAGFVATFYVVLDKRRPKLLAWTWSLFVPGAILFLYSGCTSGAGTGLQFRNLQEKITGVSALLRGYSTSLDLLSLVVMTACILLVLCNNREFHLNRVWMGISLALFALYCLLPRVYGNAWDVDLRVLSFWLPISIAALPVGRWTKALVVIGLCLITLRSANVIWNFHLQQQQLQALETSFASVPRGARLLPLVEADGERQVLRTYDHFWAFGIIQRGWLAPYLFQDPGVHPISLVFKGYVPAGFGSFYYRAPPDWRRIQADYEYVWAYNVERFSAGLQSIGDVVVASGRLRVYRIHKAR